MDVIILYCCLNKYNIRGLFKKNLTFGWEKYIISRDGFGTLIPFKAESLCLHTLRLPNLSLPKILLEDFFSNVAHLRHGVLH